MQDQLTPEEQAELQSLEAEMGTEEAPLTPEEQQELEALESGQEYTPQTSQYALPSQEQEKLVTTESVAAGLSTVEKVAEIASDQIPFADHLRAGTVSFLNQQLGDGTKTYAQVKNNIDAKQAAIQAENPVLANTTRIGTEVVQLATGTALLGKALKGVQFVSKFGKVAKAAGTAISADMAYNVSQELSQDDRDMIDKLDDAFAKGGKRTAEGAVFGLALGKSLKLAGSAVKATGIDQTLKNTIINNNVAGILKSQAKKLRGYTKQFGRDMTDIRKSLDEVGPDLDYTKPMSIVEFVEKSGGSSTALQKAGQMQGEVVNKISAATGKTLSGDRVYSNISNILDTELIKRGDFVSPEFTEKVGGLKKLMQNDFFNPDLSPKMGTASELMQTKKSVMDRIDALDLDAGLTKQLKKAANDGINDTVESAAAKFDIAKAAQAGDETVVTGANVASEDLVKQFKSARQRYQDINLLSEIVDSSHTEVGANQVFGAMRKAFYTTLPGGQSMMAVGAIGAVANTLLRSPQVLGRIAGGGSSVVGRNVSKAAGLGKFLSENADTIPAMGALSSRLYTLFTDEEKDFKSASDEFDALLDQGYSYKSLYEKPVARTNMDAKSKISDIYNIVSSTSPDLAKDLMDAYKNGEDLGPFLSEIAKRPEAKGLIEPGIGWQGKVYSPQDKASAITKLKTEYPLVSTADKILYEDNINKTGNLPLWEELPQRKPIKFVPGDKGKGNY